MLQTNWQDQSIFSTRHHHIIFSPHSQRPPLSHISPVTYLESVRLGAHVKHLLRQVRVLLDQQPDGRDADVTRRLRHVIHRVTPLLTVQDGRHRVPARQNRLSSVLGTSQHIELQTACKNDQPAAASCCILFPTCNAGPPLRNIHWMTTSAD